MIKIIIDTSGWVASFRRAGDHQLKSLVKRLIIQGKVLLPGIIRAEILRGAKNAKEYEKLSDILKSLTFLAVEDGFWERSPTFFI